MVPDEHWMELLAQFHKEKRVNIIYVIGASDTGKSSLCHYLCQEFGKGHLTAYIDCDPGQSTIGPPTTLGLNFYGDEQLSKRAYLRFIGSTSPVGAMLQTLVGMRRLLEKALALRARRVVMDSSGFVLGRAAREFQFQVIDCLHPHQLVALQQSRELEPLLKNFRRTRRICIHRLPISERVTPRSLSERQSYREQKFRQYFQQAAIIRLDMHRLAFNGIIPDFHNPDDYQGRTVALCDADHFVLVVGLLYTVDLLKKQIAIFAPPFNPEHVAGLQFGRLRLMAFLPD